ncbi:MAG: hypothetical protein KDA45_04230 [Planctomycetales bacterium]|nr:hypothetical protein [Planctomycetales bacterium]
MSELLHGQALHWASCDAAGVVTAALQSMLRERLAEESVRLRLWLAASPGQVPQIATAQPLGLALWVMHQAAELPEICRALPPTRAQPRPPLCLCFLGLGVDRRRAECAAILLESGAQVVVDELPSLQSALPGILRAAPRSQQGYHPLTAGLVERLPW